NRVLIVYLIDIFAIFIPIFPYTWFKAQDSVIYASKGSSELFICVYLIIIHSFHLSHEQPFIRHYFFLPDASKVKLFTHLNPCMTLMISKSSITHGLGTPEAHIEDNRVHTISIKFVWSGHA
ncbi:hypothetical protein ACJX0J_032018, partial [Zea mays]